MSTTEQHPGASAPSSAIERLGVLVGEWASTGELRDPASGAVVPIAGSDRYEWLEGGWFLVHRVDVRIGERRVVVLELIGEHDEASDTYACRSFDNAGNAGTMRASVDERGVWTFAGDAIRARLTIEPGGDRMAATWERAEDGGWAHWMDMRFVRRAADERPAGGPAARR